MWHRPCPPDMVGEVILIIISVFWGDRAYLIDGFVAG
ncbi:hypothetical protein SPLC1_S207700 [Arthrospira platensis C1]|nr:hypothetical protein SPLC1_S207700 [Arthrospira platensis C1]